MNITEAEALRDLLYSAQRAVCSMATNEPDNVKRTLLCLIDVNLGECVHSLALYVLADGAEPYEPPRP